jgi:hypothetical protein
MRGDYATGLNDSSIVVLSLGWGKTLFFTSKRKLQF